MAANNPDMSAFSLLLTTLQIDAKKATEATEKANDELCNKFSILPQSCQNKVIKFYGFYLGNTHKIDKLKGKMDKLKGKMEEVYKEYGSILSNPNQSNQAIPKAKFSFTDVEEKIAVMHEWRKRSDIDPAIKHNFSLLMSKSLFCEGIIVILNTAFLLIDAATLQMFVSIATQTQTPAPAVPDILQVRARIEIGVNMAESINELINFLGRVYTQIEDKLRELIETLITSHSIATIDDVSLVAGSSSPPRPGSR